MLRRIKPQQLRLGMFIEAIDGSWEGQKFWKSRFLLEKANDLVSLKAGDVTSITINTTSGVDVGSGRARSRKSASAKDQVARATQTVEQSKPLVKSMFEDARMGLSVSVDTAMQVAEDIARCMESCPHALIEVTRLKTRDEYTFQHSIAVTALMVYLGRLISMEENNIRLLAMGGLLHDIGKVHIPLEILNKAGPLTDSEMKHVRQHPQDSYDMLSRQEDFPETVLEICLFHHERPDGKGYPKGLSGDQISTAVRIASICDVYDALTSVRPYKKAWRARDAAHFMLMQPGQFDLPLVQRFFSGIKLPTNTH